LLDHLRLVGLLDHLRLVGLLDHLRLVGLLESCRRCWEVGTMGHWNVRSRQRLKLISELLSAELLISELLKIKNFFFFTGA
jgi:hypothetical protein